MIRPVLALVCALLGTVRAFVVPLSVARRGPRSLAAADSGEHVPLVHTSLAADEVARRAAAFREACNSRRTVRFYSEDHVPLSVVEDCVAAAGTAPSGAHKQPWTFVVVQNPAVKAKVRELVEIEEQVNYDKRMAETWKADLAPMMSSLHRGGAKITKPYLTEAPYAVAVFAQTYGLDPATNEKDEHYYVTQSCGIAVGLFTAALHSAGLCSLVSTPMGSERQLRELLGRPINERLFCLMPVGFPAADATVPYRDPLRKPVAEVCVVV